MRTSKSRRNIDLARKAIALRQTALFSSLSDEQLAQVALVAHERPLEPNEILFLEGAPAEHLFVVMTGVIRAYRMNKRGREQIIHVERAGATLAEIPVFDDGPYPASAASEEASIVLSIGKSDFKELCLKEPAVLWSALKILAGQLRRHAELVNSLSLQEVSSRLARLLLNEVRATGERSGAGVRFEVKLSNQQLAARIGSVREVVSRTLNRFAADGIIKIEKRSHNGMGYRFLLIKEYALKRCADLT
jgi:CRP-like cAMP-binding protein